MYKELDLLAVFFEDPERKYSLREVARLVKINPMTVRSYFIRFLKDGLLLKKDSELYPLYIAAPENKIYRNLKLYYNLEKLRKSHLIEDLESFYEYPVIILFGSYAKALDVKQSDIDLFVLSPVKNDFSVESYKKVLKRKVSIHLFTDKDFRDLQKKNPELFNNICNGFSLSGTLEIV